MAGLQVGDNSWIVRQTNEPEISQWQVLWCRVGLLHLVFFSDGLNHGTGSSPMKTMIGREDASHPDGLAVRA